MDSAGGSNLGKAAEQLLQEIQQLNDQAGQAPGGGEGFKQVMDAQQTQGVGQTQQVDGVAESKQVGEAGKINATQAKPSAVSVLQLAQQQGAPQVTAVGSAKKARNTKSLRLLQDLIQGQDKMSKIMNVALSGRKFDNNELLALQASMYHFSQEMELTSKLVQTFQQDLKQTLQTQV